MPNELTTKVTDELNGASLPTLIRGLGLAVADANAALQAGRSGVIYTIPEADIELSVAISLKSDTTVDLSGGASISVFNINATYSNTFGYTAEASSKIRLKLMAVKVPEAPVQAKDPVK